MDECRLERGMLWPGSGVPGGGVTDAETSVLAQCRPVTAAILHTLPPHHQHLHQPSIAPQYYAMSNTRTN